MHISRLALLGGFMCAALAGQALALPTIKDDSLQVESVASGFDSPTGFAFLPNQDVLVLEKDTGKVKVVHNGAVSGTALDLPVATSAEEGLLGIALHPNFQNNHYVYLYYSAANEDDGNIKANRIARFKWDDQSQQLTLNKKIIDLPGTPGPNHDGGKIAFGPDGKLYAVIGDLNKRTRTQNNTSSSTLNLSSTILRLNSSGSAPQTNPFYKKSNRNTSKAILNDVFAYGVRNSFGLAFDPVSGALWDTENGESDYDEINRVTAGFNSGWTKIMGPKKRNGGSTGKLVSLGSKAQYSDPEFSWKVTVAPTALGFVSGNLLGNSYAGDLFVGDVNTGSLYHFNLASDRKSISLSGVLDDLVADNNFNNLSAEQSSIILGDSFGVLTEIKQGSDGLYVLSLDNGELYRISSSGAGMAPLITAAPEPSSISLLALTGLLMRRRRNRSE